MTVLTTNVTIGVRKGRLAGLLNDVYRLLGWTPPTEANADESLIYLPAESVIVQVDSARIVTVGDQRFAGLTPEDYWSCVTLAIGSGAELTLVCQPDERVEVHLDYYLAEDGDAERGEAPTCEELVGKVLLRLLGESSEYQHIVSLTDAHAELVEREWPDSSVEF